MTPDLAVSVTIDATPEEIYPYLVEPELLTRWLAAWAELDPRPGGIFSVELAQTPVLGAYVTVEPPERVVFTWGVPGNDALPPGASTVEIRLRARGNSTVVELTHRDLPLNRHADHEAGWNSLLAALAVAAASQSKR